MLKYYVKGRDDEGQSAPAPGQWNEEFDEHLWPCPWHLHRRKDNLLEKSNSKGAQPAHIKVNAGNNLSSCS